MNELNLYRGPRPADLPAPVAAALSALDDLRVRAGQAERDAAELNKPERDAAAERADREAATKAITAGRPLPAAKAVPTLRDDREAARRTVEAYHAAVATAADAVSTARNEAAAGGERAEHERRLAASTRLAKLADDLAEALVTEHAARCRSDWLRTGTMPQGGPRVAPWTAFPVLGSYGVGPGRESSREMIDSAPAVIRRVVADLDGEA